MTITSPTLIRERRRSLTLSIVDNEIVIKAPFYASSSLIKKFIAKNQTWIQETTALLSQKATFQLPNFDDATQNVDFFFYGANVTVDVADIKPAGVRYDQENALITVHTSSLKRAKGLLERFCYADLEAYIKDRCKDCCSTLGVFPNDIKLRRYKSRWGCCSSDQRLVFNRALVHFPKEVIDYIVVHECCHLVHFDHSKAFWGLVEKLYPDYKNCKAYLKKYQFVIS